LQKSRYGLTLLGTMSFLETIIVPIPIELILIPYMAATPNRIWRIATAALAGCVTAAIVGYGVGGLLYESVGQWFIDTFDYQSRFQGFQAYFERHGFVAVVIVGILPIPFQLAMIAAGVASYSLVLFVAATILARGIRYYGLAWLVARFGERARRLWEDHALLASFAVAGLLLVVIGGAKYLANSIV